jgi:hypothetical protein
VHAELTGGMSRVFVAHEPGRHSDKVPERMTAQVLPFFSRVLEFEDTTSH